MSAVGETAVELAGVTLAYGDVVALDGVSLSVAVGERICVLGANGSGKSTLASVIAGLLAPDVGNVAIMGRAVHTDAGGTDFAAYAAARRDVGLVFQDPDDQIVTTVVADDVAFGPENLGVPSAEIGRRVERELERVALTPYANADPTVLSGGQRQRVAIAGALAMEPAMLVLDEPGALLDVRGRRGIMRVMDELHRGGTTVVHVTHFMEEALAADRVVVLDEGHVVLDGRPSDVFAHDRLLAGLGLEQPFAARLAANLRDRGVDVTFTCDGSALASSIAALAGTGGGEGADEAMGAGAATVPDGTHHVAVSSDGHRVAPVIDVVGASYAYVTGNERSRALDDVTLSVPAGSHVAVVGHTGSGKSTLLRLLSALDAPSSGTVVIDGVATSRRRSRRRLLGRVGYVMQHPERQLFAETVYDDVAFGPSNLGLSAAEVSARVDDALMTVGLTDKRDASPFQLSGGQQRLCALAGVLALSPTIIVLDEPTAGLDPRGRQIVRHVLADVHARGVTIVEVTHAMDDAAIADQVIVLSHGTARIIGPPGHVFSDANAALLHELGLGLPAPLAFARSLEAAGLPPLGSPLDIDGLAHAIIATLRQGSHASLPRGTQGG